MKAVTYGIIVLLLIIVTIQWNNNKELEQMQSNDYTIRLDSLNKAHNQALRDQTKALDVLLISVKKSLYESIELTNEGMILISSDSIEITKEERDSIYAILIKM